MEGIKLCFKWLVLSVFLTTVFVTFLYSVPSLQMQTLQYLRPKIRQYLHPVGDSYTTVYKGTQEEKVNNAFTSANINVAEENNDWRESMAERFKVRQNLLQKQCSKYRGNLPSVKTNLLLNTFLYSKKYHLLTCINAKGGATTWRLHFLHMNDNDELDEKTFSGLAKRNVSAIKQFGKKKLVTNGLKSSRMTRVISVRHPLARVVSAYTDKLYGGRQVILNSTSKHQHLKMLLKFEKKSKSNGVSVSISFLQFLNFIIHQKNRSVGSMNPHWLPFISRCDPCGISYDYIVQLETFKDDLRYIVHKLDIKEIDVSVTKNKSVKKKALNYEEYFKGIPHNVIKEIYSIYEKDFYLFGYEVPMFVKDALATSP